jgi:Cys-tRNA(Pro)/Cys-tRNA(Cys) deacylase
MTPAIVLLKRNQIAHRVHEYAHDKAAASYGEEAAEKLGIEFGRVFKTLVIAADDGLAVCVVPVDHQLDLKKAARALGAKKCQMAEVRLVERTTGYVVGGVSPLGQKKALPTLIDDSARHYATVYVSAGKRGLEIELAPADLCAAAAGRFADIRKEGNSG